MKLSRLSGRKTCERLIKNGQIFKGKTMIIRWLPEVPKKPNTNPGIPAIYVGTMASAKLHKSAVKRNRMRRRCREALRVRIKEINKIGPAQLLISPKIASLSCDFSDIQSDIDRFLSLLF